MNCKDCRLNAVLEEIDFLKIYMNELSEYVESLSDPAIVEISQLLDKKLNLYQSLTH